MAPYVERGEARRAPGQKPSQGVDNVATIPMELYHSAIDDVLVLITAVERFQPCTFLQRLENCLPSPCSQPIISGIEAKTLQQEVYAALFEGRPEKKCKRTES